VKNSGNASPPFSLSKSNDLAWGVTLIACWFWTFSQLSLAWSAFPNYEFGYFVPWIAILLAWRRIQDSPGSLDRVPSTRLCNPLLAGSGILLAWGILLFAELVRQFDPHWRMVGWLMMVSVTLLTGIALWLRGGNKLLGVLAFPLAFTWSAVPWPTKLEEMVTLTLRDFVTRGAVATLHAARIPAEQHGNVIDLVGGSVVVDSACSGISSFQVSIMASLFLGEYFRFRAGKRLLLLAAGSLCAVAGNFLRATALVWLVNEGGPAALLKYHDSLGYAETAGIFLALVLGAWCLSLKSSIPLTETLEPLHTMSIAKPPRSPARRAWASVEGAAALSAFALIPLITCAWFALSPGGPVRKQDVPLWFVKADARSPEWQVKPIALSPMDLRTLDFNQGQTISLAGPSDTDAVIYHFFWKTDASTGYGHTPDHCMLAAGWELEGAPVATSIQVNNAGFQGRTYHFKRGGQEEVVFQSVWYGGDPMLSAGEFPYARGGPRTSRLAMLWDQPRRRGLESLNVYMPPAADPAAQSRMAQQLLAQVLVPNR
jgi:exosortase